MNGDGRSASDSNVVSLAEVRRQRLLTPNAGSAETNPGRELELVMFVTSGRFECAVNGFVAPLLMGDFVRVPPVLHFSVRDVGPLPGSIVSRHFLPGIEPGFFRELATALPRGSCQFPARSSQDYARLRDIATRWGVSLDCGAAA